MTLSDSMENAHGGSPNPPPIRLALDFTALPLAEIVSTLRLIGQNLLLNLLQDGPRPDWPTFLSPEQTRILVQPPLFTPRQLISRVAWLTPGFRYKNVVAQAIAGNLSSAQWQTRLVGRLEQYFGGLPPHYLPDDLWPVISEVAWRDLDFQHWVAAQVRIHFRSQVLFTRGQRPVVALSPQIFWLLIALTGSSTPVAILKSSPAQRLMSQAIKRLQNEGQRQALTVGWAGFWEQWIVLETRRRWPEALHQLDSPLREAVLALPLVVANSPPTTEPKDVQVSAPAEPDQRPTWLSRAKNQAGKLNPAVKYIQLKLPDRRLKQLQQLLFYRRLEANAKPAPPELANPNWAKAMPDWFGAYLNLMDWENGGKR